MIKFIRYDTNGDIVGYGRCQDHLIDTRKKPGTNLLIIDRKIGITKINKTHKIDISDKKNHKLVKKNN